MQKRSFGLACLFLSAIVGAGFATGREIMTYFARYGLPGFAGLGISSLLLAAAGSRLYVLAYRMETDSPLLVSRRLAGQRMGKLLAICIALFSYCIYVIMLAGTSDLAGSNLPAFQKFWPRFLLTAVISLLSYLVLLRGFESLAALCAVFAPVIAISLAVSAVLSSFCCTETAEVFHLFSAGAEQGNISGTQSLSDTLLVYGQMLFSAVLYAGYNTLVAASILPRAGTVIPNRRTAVLGGIFGGLLFFACGAAVYAALYHSWPDIHYAAMPLLMLAGRLGTFGKAAFPAVLGLTMILSAVAGLSGCCVSFTADRKRQKRLGVLLAAAAVPLSLIGFGSLMDILYPIFGFAGIFLLIMLALDSGKTV